ncbi:MAG: molybdopterin-dependent oxidoreductase [Desulfobacterales bacterium]|nr:molybdopterin-dependent oxidoreductase [Desulfobacterales bacterium]
MIKKTLKVNGIDRTVVVREDDSLAKVVREQLKLTGTKVGCGEGQCGCCNVIMNDKLVRSCVTKMSKVKNDASITTIEGIGTPDAPHPLQKAWTLHGGAQCGFCSPGFIVSSKSLLDKNDNPDREEIRDWYNAHRNACRCTGYKPLVDATMDAAKVMRGEKDIEELEFKMPADGRIWGSSIPRPTAMAKVTGTIDYGADLGIKMPDNTLVLALVQAKVSHANIKSIDTSAAEKMPGVHKILTYKDVVGSNRINGLVTFPDTNLGDGLERPILCDKKVFQYGDAIAIVCADTESNAKAAAKKVVVDLEELPAYMSAPEAMAEDAMEIHPGTPNVYFNCKIEKGEETGPIFKDAAHVVEDDFYVGRQPHMPMEPCVGFAYTDDNGNLFINSKSIALYVHNFMIAEGLGIAEDKLFIAQNPTGGTFGHKFSPTTEALLGVASMATGRPTYLCYDYHQQMTYTGKRSPFFINLKMAADNDGKLLAMESDWSVDHGPYSEFGDLLTTRGNQFIGAGYSIPNIRGNGRTVCTNHGWGSAFRAYGAPQSEFASEVLMDELAEKIGLDPFELRYKNILRPGDTMPHGQKPEVYSYEEMMDILKPKYEAALKKAKENSDDKTKRGVGISLGMYGCGADGPDPSECAIELGPDNVVTLFNTWEDHGQGADIGTLGTAHEALRPLNVPPKKIRLALNDMATAPDSGASGGSRQQVVTGRAIVAACRALLDGMRKPDGSYHTYDEMVAENLPLKYSGKWTTPCTVPDDKGQGEPFAVYMYGIFLAEVAIDIATGKATVEKMTCVADIGKICNRLATDGQIYGGLAQGIGLALTEDFEDIQKHSTLKGAGLPYAKDIPDNMEIVYVENERPEGPFGAAGCGELPLTSPHAAIINAINNACGVRITRLPALPEKVLAGLK